MLQALKQWYSTPNELDAVDRRELLDDLFVFGKDNQAPFLRRMAYLLVISTIIACCGLMADSAAVVIGAMLVAPVMRPVMISAAAISLGWSQYLYQALLLTLAMAVSAVSIAALFAWASPELVNIPGQVLARTEPTYFDLIIALAAGSGGAYTMTHRESSAIPGVAMAVALLPPLASTGILLVLQENELALKAFILFFTNFAAMVLAATLTFLYVGVAPRKTRERSSKTIRNFLIGFFLLVVGVSVPLYFLSTEVWYDATYQANQSEELQSWLKENELIIEDVKIDEERRILFLKLLGPNPPLSVETLHDELEKRFYAAFGTEAKPFSIEVLWTQTARFSWPPELTQQTDKRELVVNYLPQLQKHTWYWIGTQYADGDWLRPANKNAYQLRIPSEESLDVVIHCGEGRGGLALNQEEIAITFDIEVDENCTAAKQDKRFVTDLNNAINLDIEDEHLSLRLDSDSGVMHFESTASKSN